MDLIQRIIAYPVFSRDGSAFNESAANDTHDTVITQNLIENISAPKPVIISKEKRQETGSQIQELFDITVPETFFDFGGLLRKVALVPQKTEYIGNDDEKSKYDKYEELEFVIAQLSLLDVFIGTFTGLQILPLCILHNSSQADEEITISIRIINGVPIRPSRDLFNPDFSSSGEYTGLEGFVYEEGMIKEILFLPENSIQYDTDISYDIQDSLRESQRNVQKYFSGRTSNATAADYEYEIKKFIANTAERTTDPIYEFEISKLRPQEKKWLGPLILVKPMEDSQISLTYAIKSTHSSGIVEGTLT